MNYSKTNLTELPTNLNNLINLEELHINNNHLKNFQLKFEKLKSFDCSNNQISNINVISYFTHLEKLNCSDNEITELPENLGDLSKLIFLDCANNKIEKIPKSMSSLYLLQHLNLSKNELIEVPNEIMYCKSLVYINLGCVELNHYIVEFINKIQTIHNHSRYYRNGYEITVHDTNIQEKVKEIVEKLLKDDYTINHEILKIEIMNNEHIEFKELLLNYMESPEYHPTLQCMFIDVFEKVYGRIKNRKDIWKNLIFQLHHSDCKCITGLITRLVYALNDQYDDIHFYSLEDDNDVAIINIIMDHKRKYHDVNKFVKNQIGDNLKSRDYSEETIGIWYESLL